MPNKMLFVCFGFLLVLSHAVYADGQSYQATGDVTMNGVGCPTCSENIAFSVDLDYQQVSPAGAPYPLYSIFATNLQSIWSGTLGSMTATIPSTPTWGGYYLNMFGPNGDEVDLNGTFPDGTATPVAPTIYSADLYSCFTADCVSDFVPTNLQQNGSVPLSGIFFPETLSNVTVTSVPPTAVPEPSTILLLILGLAALGLLLHITNRVGHSRQF